MEIPISSLVVNRSSLTRRFGMAGAPLETMYTHWPLMFDCLHSPKTVDSLFGQLPYNSIQCSSKHGGGHATLKSLMDLVKDISKHGVTEPVTGYVLKDRECVELFGGHHRALIAKAVGYQTIHINPKPLDVHVQMAIDKINSVRDVYKHVPGPESLRMGQSYNVWPGLKPIRPTCLERLKMVYREILTCSGDRLLDLGCNDGYFGTALSQHDFSVTFVDRSEPYLNVVKAKMTALGTKCTVAHVDATEFLQSCNGGYDVTLYMDVFYHTVLERGVEAAIQQLKLLIDKTHECLIISPGRWDKLVAAGITPAALSTILRVGSKRIRYLGRDHDKGYEREIYAVHY